MQTQALSLREKARRSFEARKSDHQARLAFLKDAKILDASGKYNTNSFLNHLLILIRLELNN